MQRSDGDTFKRAAWTVVLLAKLRKAGGTIQPSISGQRGEAAVVGFDSQLRTLLEFTSDANAVEGCFRRLGAYAKATSGRMLDAVRMAAKMWEGRRAEERRCC